MLIGNILYFSPNYRFTQIDWDNKEELIKAFEDRVNGFYLDPAEKLNCIKTAFATGVMCVAAIDSLARIETGLKEVRKRFEGWLKSHISAFDKPDPKNSSQTLAYRFYDDFRNGLLHEGRIKHCSQFSYHYKDIVFIKKEVMLINPENLLKDVKKVFGEYILNVKTSHEAFGKLKEALKRDFQEDVEYAKRK